MSVVCSSRPFADLSRLLLPSSFSRRKLPSTFCALTFVALLAPQASVARAAQAHVEGFVLNGTTQKPVVNQRVQLLMPRGGMQEVGTATTDIKGRFAFAQSEIDSAGFYLLATNFQGVNYHAPVRFDGTGQAAINLPVYEATRSATALRIQLLRALVRAEGSKARVQEEFDVLNSSDPPRAYANPEGTFRFRVSPGASEPTVGVVGLMNMLLPQTPQRGKADGEYFFTYALKPGVTQVAISYDTEYAASGLSLADRVSYPIETAEFYVSPMNLSVESSLFKAGGTDAGHNVQKLEARNLAPNKPLELRVAGEAPAGAPGEGEQPEVKVTPNSMTRLGWPLLGCLLLVLLWALGVRAAREWPQWKARRGATPAQKQLGARFDALVNSLADLDELFAAGKIEEKKYWKERLELKAKLVAILKKVPPPQLASYATRKTAR